MVIRCAGVVTPGSSSGFSGFRFPPDVIVLAVRWYLRYGLSYQDVEELLAERGIEVDHVTIYRWVQRFTPLLVEAARPCRHLVGDRWLVDETYVRVAGVWRYLYRAIDQFGQVVDVFLSTRRDAKAAQRFFLGAISRSQTSRPRLSPTEPLRTSRSLTRCSPAPSTTLIDMPTTPSSATTDVSKLDFDRCGA